MKTAELKEIIKTKPVSEARKVTLYGIVKTIEEMGVQEIDSTFYPRYMDALRAKGYGINTLGKSVSGLKNLLSESGVSTKGWKSPKQETDNIYLTEQELQQLWDCKHLEGTTLKVAHIFLAMAWTGLRVSDYLKLNEAVIEDGMYKIRAQKTGAWAYIPIHPILRKILNLYNGNLPKYSNATINVHIKIACQAARILKYKEVKSHSSRRSLCSNLYLKKVPADAIMLMSSHKNISNFMRYVKCSEKDKIGLIKNVWK